MTLRIRTIITNEDGLRLHPLLSVSFDGNTFEAQQFCGYTHCDGTCGFPALVVDRDGEELKAHSSMTACGPVFQRFRTKWAGTKVVVPESAGELVALLKMWWS